MNTFRSFLGVMTLAALPALTACGGLGSGDYLVFRVGVSDQELSADCYDNDVPESVAEDKSTFRAGATFVLYYVNDTEARLDSGSLVLEGDGDGETFSFDGSSTDVEPFGGQTIWDADHDGIDDINDPVVDSDLDGLDDDDSTIDTFVDVDADGLDDRFEDPIVDSNSDGEDDRSVQLPSTSRQIQKTSVEVDLTFDGEVVIGDSKAKSTLTCEGGQCPVDFVGGSCTTKFEFEGVIIEDADVAVAPSAEAPAP